jgi:transposase-like protein
VRGHYPAEVTTARAQAYPRVLDEVIPSALHTVERYANNPVEADHGPPKARLGPMRGLKRHQSARTQAQPGTPLSRTSAAATTNSPPTSPPATGSAKPSTSSP